MVCRFSVAGNFPGLGSASWVCSLGNFRELKYARFFWRYVSCVLSRCSWRGEVSTRMRQEGEVNGKFWVLALSCSESLTLLPFPLSYTELKFIIWQGRRTLKSLPVLVFFLFHNQPMPVLQYYLLASHTFGVSCSRSGITTAFALMLKQFLRLLCLLALLSSLTHC